VEGPAFLSACELRNAFRAALISPVEAFDSIAERIAQVDPVVDAFTTLCLERARDEAREAERAYAQGRARPLEGIPLAVKDLFDSAGVRTTYGSPMFDAHVPERDAEAVRRARAAGAILIGKTATHEFAWGITSVNPHQGSPRNPWALERFTGGSSGGSAATLATYQVPLALGSDTGGSIRVPSAFCGTVGLKPTYGRVSLAGCFPLARSLDHAGPMARTPADAALLLEAVAGVDPADPATSDIPLGELEASLSYGFDGVKVGVCSDLHLIPPADDVQAVFDEAVGVVASRGGEIVEVRFPVADRIYDTFGHIQRAEALFSHERAGLFPARRDEYGEDVRERLELATRETLPAYLEASAERQRIRAAFSALFREVDVLLTPVSAGRPLPIGEDDVEHRGRTIAFRELVMGYTVPQDLAGIPACGVRAGFDELGIPVGIQFTGPLWSDAMVLRAAQAFVDATPEVQGRRPTWFDEGREAVVYSVESFRKGV
jgi:aspartyl-tRNA(Asn)/glutamyl-tRNA(Gln) amidotransferase subunit A